MPLPFGTLLLLAKLATQLLLKPDTDSYSIVETESLILICLNTISIKTFAFKWLNLIIDQ